MITAAIAKRLNTQAEDAINAAFFETLFDDAIRKAANDRKRSVDVYFSTYTDKQQKIMFEVADRYVKEGFKAYVDDAPVLTFEWK